MHFFDFVSEQEEQATMHMGMLARDHNAGTIHLIRLMTHIPRYSREQRYAQALVFSPFSASLLSLGGSIET